MRIRCPKCQAVLNIANPAPGRKIGCPRCQKFLVLPAQAACPVPAPVPAPELEPKKEESSPQAADSPRPRRARERKQWPAALLWGGGAAFCLAAVVLTYYVAFSLMRPDSTSVVPAPPLPTKQKAAPLAQNNPKPAPRKAPTKPAQPPQKRPPARAPIPGLVALEPYVPPPQDEPEKVLAPLPPAEPIAPGTLAPLLYLEKADPPVDFSPTKSYPVLAREVVRQAFFLTAHGGLGLATRDGSLGEAPPAGLAPENSLYVSTIFRENGPVQLALERGPAEARKYIWKDECAAKGPGQLAALVARMEELSRSQLKQALAKAGFSGQPIPVKADVRVPDDVEPLLQQMNFIAQFAALRKLHAVQTSAGESPALLGALVRAYANLGVLTECHGNAAARVAKARALLYAQRLVQSAGTPWNYWHRAYARALCGLHQAALDDLTQARRGASAHKGPAPSWVDLIEAYCHFDTNQVERLAANAGLGQLGRLLAFFTVEDPWATSQTIAKGRAVLADNPECYRVHGALSALGGVANQHRTTLEGYKVFGETIRTRLRGLPGLPEGAAQRLQGAEADIYAELAESSLDLQSQPSWAWLATMAREERFLQVYRRLHFMAFLWNVPVKDFLEEGLPLVRDHPNRAYIEKFKDEDPARTIMLLARLPLEDISYHQVDIVIALHKTNPEIALRHFKRLDRLADQNYQDITLRNRNFTFNQEKRNAALARNLGTISPDAPLARVLAVRFDWKTVKDRAAAWEKDCEHASLLFELGKRYIADRRYADAERCLKRCVTFSPDLDVFKHLADIYKYQNNDKAWRAALLAYLEVEDTGLGHAMVQDTIAHYHMKRGEWQEALPLAEAAAASWAAFAMNTASCCNEGLKNWQRAELWIRRLTERYDEGFAWYFWCRRTGRGEIAAAEEFAKQFYEQMSEHAPPNIHPKLAVYLTLTNRPELAHAHWQQAIAEHRAEGYALFLALDFDARGDKAGRDALFRSILRGVNPYASLGKAFLECVAQGEQGRLNAAALEASLKNSPPELNPDIDYFVGHFLYLHNQKELGIQLLKRAALAPRNVVQPEKAWIGPVLASVLVRELAGKVK